MPAAANPHRKRQKRNGCSLDRNEFTPGVVLFTNPFHEPLKVSSHGCRPASLPALRSSGLPMSVYLKPTLAVVTELSRSPAHIKRRTRSSNHSQNRRRALRRVHASSLRMQKSGSHEQRAKKDNADKNFHAERGAALLFKNGTTANLSQHTSHPPPQQQNLLGAYLPRYPLQTGSPTRPMGRRSASCRQVVISTEADSSIVRAVERPLYLQ